MAFTEISRAMIKKADKVTKKFICFDDGKKVERTEREVEGYILQNFVDLLKGVENPEAINITNIESLAKESAKQVKEIAYTIRTGRDYFDIQSAEMPFSERGTELNCGNVNIFIDMNADSPQRAYYITDINYRYMPLASYYGLQTTLNKYDLEEILDRKISGQIIYDPRTSKPLLDFSEYTDDPRLQGYMALNIYCPPEHRLHPIVKPKVDPLLLRFIKHLFVTPECFQFMMESLWYVLNERLQIIIVMNGGTGIGKSLFSEKLITELVGKPNARQVPKGWSKSNFNAWMDRAQYLYFDEAKINAHNDEETGYLKKLTNDYNNIEKKGVDAVNITRNFASFFVTSNNGTKNFTMELDNRRFCPVDVTETKLVAEFSPQEVSKIVELVEDPDAVANFYWWIQNEWDPAKTNPNRTPLTLLECETLYYFRYESLSIWQKVIVDMATSGKVAEILYSEAVDEYRDRKGRDSKVRWNVKWSSIVEFLKIYRHRDMKVPIGEFVDLTENEDEKWKIIVHPSLLGKEGKMDKKYGFELL